MRRFTNKEAIAVSDLVATSSQIRKLESNLRKLKKEQTEMRDAVKQIVTKHGEAHNAAHMITITQDHRNGYEVKANTFDRFNISERGNVT